MSTFTAVTTGTRSDGRRIAKPVVCRDGFKMSVQASEGHYCTPHDNDGPYTAVEVGYPSGPVPASWVEYADDGTITSDVFGWVPVEMVAALIAEHGGEA